MHAVYVGQSLADPAEPLSKTCGTPALSALVFAIFHAALAGSVAVEKVHRVFRFGPFELDEGVQELRCEEASTAIDPRAWNVLLYLIEHRARVIDKDELRRSVWSGLSISDATVWSALRDVRRALGDHPERWLQTVRRRGYRFIGTVEVRAIPQQIAAERSPRGAPSESHGAAAPSGWRIHGAPRSPSLCFVGRSEELGALEETLAKEAYLSIQASIEGLAGVGKTELALQLVHRAVHRGRFAGGVFWLDAENPDLRRIWGTTFADRYGLAEGSLDERCQILLRRLGQSRDPILVVLDNANSWSSGERPGPLPEGDHVRVLVTTRTRNLGGAQLSHLALGVLSSPHDREFLVRLAGRDVEPGLEELLEHLEGHALALELAGAYLATFLGETAASYLDALQRDSDATEATVIDRVRYERTVMQSFRTVWDCLSERARGAWRLAACFEAEPASRALAQSVGLDTTGLRSLEALHLIQTSSDGRWSMHRLTRRFGLQIGTPEQVNAASARFVDGCLAQAESYATPDGVTTYALDRAHVDASLRTAEQLWGEDAEKLRMLAHRVALARAALGDLAGSSALLEPLIRRYRTALSALPREQQPLDWAEIQRMLAQALRILGGQAMGVEKLQQSVQAYRACLQEYTSERDSALWLRVQGELALALAALGYREREPERLEEAVHAYRCALRECSRQELPWEWASLQDDLGNVLCALGRREPGSARLEEAVCAFRAALLERTRERTPMAWAQTQRDLGAALWNLGESEASSARLEEAIASFRAALLEFTRERTPVAWARTQNQLGMALTSLGERDVGTERLAEGIHAFREALLELDRDRVPLEWAATQNNLGLALRAFSDREPGTARLEDSIQAYRDALLEHTREAVPLLWAATQNNLGVALRCLGERETGTASLEAAVEAFRDALLERTRERLPLAWATTQSNLGDVLMRLGEREPGTARLEDALRVYGAALLERTRERVPLFWAATQKRMGDVAARLAARENSTTRLQAAIAAYRTALQELTREHVPRFWAETQQDLCAALMRCAEHESGAAPVEEAERARRAAQTVFDAERDPERWKELQECGERLRAERARREARGPRPTS